MLSPEQKSEVQQIVSETIQKMGAAFRKSISSVDVGRTSTGKPTFSVKVYHDDPIEAARITLEIEAELALKYFQMSKDKENPFPKKGGNADSQKSATPAPASAPAPGEEEKPLDEDPFKEEF